SSTETKARSLRIASRAYRNPLLSPPSAPHSPAIDMLPTREFPNTRSRGWHDPLAATSKSTSTMCRWGAMTEEEGWIEYQKSNRRMRGARERTLEQLRPRTVTAIAISLAAPVAGVAGKLATRTPHWHNGGSLRCIRAPLGWLSDRPSRRKAWAKRRQHTVDAR